MARVIGFGSIDLCELAVQHILGGLTKPRSRIEIKDRQISQQRSRGVFVPAQHFDSVGSPVIEVARAGKRLFA
jgi:hypothetical protein